MRVAFLVDESLPEGTRVHAKMIHELALEFQKQGHSSVVIAPGKPDQETLMAYTKIDGVALWRFRSGYIRGVGMIRRLINEWLLSYRLRKAMPGNTELHSFDLCVSYTPTIFYGPFTKYLKSRGTYIYQVLRDDFPQWLIDQGIISRWSPLSLFLKHYEKLNYKTADCVGVMSRANLLLFQAKNPSCSNSEVLMNWTSIVRDESVQPNTEIRIKHNLTEKVIFFYGGNLGHANDMPNIVRLARSLSNYGKAHFLIIGQGDQYNLICELVRDWGLKNVTILPSVSQDEFKRILKVIDVGLFSLSKHHTAHNFPGKILGYMADGIPILGSTNPNNDLVHVIDESGAGFIHVNGEDEALAASAIKLLEDEATREHCGNQARLLLGKYFSVENAYTKIVSKC